ncbi:MAG: hypothetical protein ACK4YP_12145 [Myxococcota bacterium]
MTPLLALLPLVLADPPEVATRDADDPPSFEAPEEARTARLTTTPTPAVAPLGPIATQVPWAAARLLPPPLPELPRAWHELPVAFAPHPVAYHYGRRFQSLVRGKMGGTRASPVFGPTVAEADVHWRLLQETGRGLPLDPGDAERWRDMALAGSLLAGESLMTETLERAPTLYGVYVVGDTLLSPSFDVRPVGKDRVEVRHRDGGNTSRRVERDEEELAIDRPRRRPPPKMSTGLDWELRDESAPKSAPLVEYTAWLSATELGLTSFRVEVAPTSLAWNVSGRQEVLPRVYLIGSARSVGTGAEPNRLAGGLMWLPPLPGSCNVRGERIVTLEEPDERWMVTLRCENKTPIPSPVDRPLGDRGRGGPALPWVPERGPNVVKEW